MGYSDPNIGYDERGRAFNKKVRRVLRAADENKKYSYKDLEKALKESLPNMVFDAVKALFHVWTFFFGLAIGYFLYEYVKIVSDFLESL